ncbi:MAG: hypothetical protein GY801_53330 [bacterium]|nr:hypothetical protein [bacterium]
MRGDYTIDPLWMGFYVAAKKYKGFIAHTDETLNEIEQLRNLRNWVGAHWNEWAQTLTSAEADAFTRAVLNLREKVYCEKCKQYIAKIGGLDGIWACKQEHKRYSKNLSS